MEVDELLRCQDIAVGWAQRYRSSEQKRSSVYDSDQYGIAWLGMMEAYHTFNPNHVSPHTNKPVSFRTYANKCVRSALSHYYRSKRAIKRGGVGTNNEQLPPVKVFAFTDLEDSLYDGFRVDFAAPEYDPDMDLVEWCARLMSSLHPRDAQIVQATVMEGRSTHEVGACLGISHTRVRELRDRGMRTLRQLVQAQGYETLE